MHGQTKTETDEMVKHIEKGKIRTPWGINRSRRQMLTYCDTMAAFVFALAAAIEIPNSVLDPCRPHKNVLLNSDSECCSFGSFDI